MVFEEMSNFLQLFLPEKLMKTPKHDLNQMSEPFTHKSLPFVVDRNKTG